MGRIKSALEIAMEHTELVKTDKSSVGLFEVKQQGKKLANDFLAGGINLTDEIKKTPAQHQDSLKQGIFDILVSQISLPSVKEDEKRIDTVCKGLQIIIKDSGFNTVYKQVTQLISGYLQEAAQYGQAIRQQYAPRLRQKEEELSNRLGREVRIDPFQDPEFVAFHNQHINALKSNYESILDQAREEARRMFEAGCN
jgi:hypothetical protein